VLRVSIDAMRNSDARAALRQLIEIFCDFWSFDREAMVNLQRAGLGDTEFEESIKARNERRRGAISVLIARMTGKEEVPPKAAADVTDLLFVLTGFPVFSGLTAGGRTKDAACALIQTAAEDAIRRGINPSKSQTE
jgi:hypothetical protein